MMQPRPDTSLALRGEPVLLVEDHPTQAPDPETGPRGDRAIHCASCKAEITTVRQQIAVAGSHEHRFVNPAGLVFHIGCFAEALGCIVIGPDSLECPWFAGFAWRYAKCGACGFHLGWQFRSEGRPGFFGLILDRLVHLDLGP